MPPHEKPIKKSDVVKSANKKPEVRKEKPAPVKSSRPTIQPKKQTISKAEVLRKAEEAKRHKEEELLRKEEEERLRIEEEERRLLEEQEEQGEEETQQQRKSKRPDKYAALGMKMNLQIFDSSLTDEERQQQSQELAEMMKGGAMATEEEIKQKEEQRRAKKEQVEKEEVKQEEGEQLEDWEKGVTGELSGFDDSEDDTVKADAKKEAAAKKRIEQDAKQSQEESSYKYRSPIVCVLGHVDTGKTSLLDKIRQSTVEEREEGGITQQIGASFLSQQFIEEKLVNFPKKVTFKVPGLLIVDTPGHESFANLRSRGSSLADIAILVVDINHGIEAQTKESIALLKANNTPFVIALNKIDRLYNWKSENNRDSESTLNAEAKPSRQDFEKKYNEILEEFGDLDYNLDFWWKVNDKETVPVVPTSAVTGEGLPDLLAMLITYTQKLMKERITYKDEVQCVILEVRKTEGFGYTLDCILVNGMLKRGQKIVLAGQTGPICTDIEALLTPQEAKEIREASASDYKRNDELQAAIGCKIAAKDLELAVAGTPVYVADDDEEAEILKEVVMQEIHDQIKDLNNDIGVYVNSSSMGALEALIGYLRSENTETQRAPIQISGAAIGPVTKQIIEEVSLQHERNHPELAVVLAFDVSIDKDVIEKAKELKVKIIQSKIIYQLYDKYWDFVAEWHKQERERLKAEIVYPAVLKVLAVFHTHDPLICGFLVKQGELRLNMPLALRDREGGKFVGKVASIESEHKAMDCATAGMEVAVRIDGNFEAGKDGVFDVDDMVYTKITRRSIDIMKLHFENELRNGWGGVIKAMKTELMIQ